MTVTPSNNSPIFILGIMQRSGTNYFYDLLRLHPRCGSSTLFFEDNLTRYSDSLINYVSSLRKSWEAIKTVDPETEAALLRHLGDGILSFLESQVGEGQRVLVKTPSVENLPHFFRLFPSVSLLLLVRDGRAVVESGMKGFGWNFEKATRNWARAARSILDFDRVTKNSGHRYLIVRYEDLVTDLEKEVRRVLDFLGLDASQYDFQAAARLPVRGSSLFRGTGATENRVHWRPLEKNPEFNPLGRWERWGAFRHKRFNWIAGGALSLFGHQKQFDKDGFLEGMVHGGLDGTWKVREGLHRALSKVRIFFSR